MTDLLATAHEAVRTLPSPLPAARGPLSAALLVDLAGGSAAPVAPGPGTAAADARAIAS
ncbi:iron-containing redox enzyme family protein, partial [Clavibacter phaseoli]